MPPMPVLTLSPLPRQATLTDPAGPGPPSRPSTTVHLLWGAFPDTVSPHPDLVRVRAFSFALLNNRPWLFLARHSCTKLSMVFMIISSTETVFVTHRGELWPHYLLLKLSKCVPSSTYFYFLKSCLKTLNSHRTLRAALVFSNSGPEWTILISGTR